MKSTFLLISILSICANSGCAKEDDLAGIEVVPSAKHKTEKVVETKSKPKAIDVIPFDKKRQYRWNPKGIAEFSFTERSGKTVTREDLLGQDTLVCFIFTRCAGLCTQVSGTMYKLQKDLQDYDVKYVSFSVDPQFDNPEVLRKYAAGFDADKNRWLFLTGDKKKIVSYIGENFKQHVREVVGPDRKPGWEVEHTGNIMHLDATGRVLGEYNVNHSEDLRRLKKAIRSNAKKIPRQKKSDLQKQQ